MINTNWKPEFKIGDAVTVTVEGAAYEAVVTAHRNVCSWNPRMGYEVRGPAMMTVADADKLTRRKAA